MKRNLFQELQEGMAAAEQYLQGKATLKTVTVEKSEPVHIEPAEIRAIREQLNLSQAVFAAKLRTSVRTYQGWEQGKTRPNPQAALLLRMVQKSPKTFKAIASA
ncbi:helix-turn-helix domain-containing protein [Neisseria shayeganii]|uniref:Helix-turn-helix domain-containing protein n=1 Tax=Neisseria shayeganii TaxID=607712 RepID=A0A7D7N574_9NEIS|nr:helix-turn-helix domain-containing protein [Neisseria shayeganii]QMT39823.1 helix-turn-helix domain-containing protein [Neisseria shayeganii]